MIDESSGSEDDSSESRSRTKSTQNENLWCFRKVK